MALPTVAVAFIAHDQNGNPVAGARVQAKLDQTEIYQGFVVPEVVEATADATGAVSLDLWPNELGVAGSAYQVRAWNPDTGKKFLDARAVVPNANCNLYQILVQEPYPPIDAAEQALIAAQGALADVTTQALIASTAATSAQDSAASAASSATVASGSASNAAASAANASDSAASAGSSATTAGQQAGAATSAAAMALGAADAALVSQNAAASSATSAADSATLAGQHRTQSGLDVQATAASATAAQTAANQASTSASTSAQNASAAAASATTAGQHATNAAASAATATTKAGEAAGSAASALAIYGNTAAQQAAVTAAQNAASVAAGHAASASSVVQQDLSGVNAAALHRSPNAVTAMFVYDTSKDSDGGAWTEKCQHTSWYNEAINGKWLGAQASEAAARAVSGATTGDYFQLTTDGKFYKLNATSGTTEVFRGNKREFPKLSAIVAEASNVTIYDLTEPGRPMWARTITELLRINGGFQAISATNGSICIGSASNVMPLGIFNYTKDDLRVGVSGYYTTPALKYRRIADRNLNTGGYGDSKILQSRDGLQLAGAGVNSVAMTVLPDAPVDPVTGLQVPTIWAATSGGVSRISHSGVVTNSAAIGWPDGDMKLKIVGNYIVRYGVGDGYYNYLQFIPTTSPASATWQHYSPRKTGAVIISGGFGGKAVSTNLGVELSQAYPTDPTRGASATIRSSYNTGHMVGDIRRAYLSDIEAGSISGTELAPSLDAWTLFPAEATSISIVDGKLVVSNTRISGSIVASVNITGLTVGKTYKAGYTLGEFSGAGVSLNFATNGTIRGANGTFYDSFVATATSHTLSFMSRNAGGVSFAASVVSLKEVVVDRSYKSQAANIAGTLTKTPVA